MLYYTAKDVSDLTGLGQTASYAIIKDLNIKLKREYPGTLIIKGKIPKWYFEEKTKCIKKGEENER